MKLIPKYQLAGKLPTAPKVEDRYKEGTKKQKTVQEKDQTFSRIYPLREIKTVIANDNLFPSKIEQQIYQGITPEINDTVYIETTGHNNPFVTILPRRAMKQSGLYTNTYSRPNGPLSGRYWPGIRTNKGEFEILKRRFNTAWNINSK